jgi:hypothetical protein
LLLQIAGPERRITEQKFVSGICSYLRFGGVQAPPIAAPVVANPQANAPHPAVAARLKLFYEQVFG